MFLPVPCQFLLYVEEIAMLNLFVTYKCSLNCNYCFANGLTDDFPSAMTWENFSRLSHWIKKNGVVALALLGGEPTLHPQIAEIISYLRNGGVMTALFTNGLFKEGLREVLAGNVTNFVVNYNDPSTYLDSQWKLLQGNLGYLVEKGCRVGFSKNFAKQYTRYDYLLDACREYGVKHVRYDITRPNPKKYNGHYDLEDTKKVLDVVVSFVRECDAGGVKTGLDCCIPLCYFNAVDAEFLKKVSTKFSGICHPSIDIHPDLSASYCLPMRRVTVDDVTKYSGERALFKHFSESVRNIRFDNPSPACMECSDFKTRCQGGCLALKGG